MLVEITKGIIDNFKVASVKIMPSSRPGDNLDFEFILRHDQMEKAEVLGFVVITYSRDVLPCAVPVNATMSEAAEKRAVKIIKRICRQMMKEWE